jgi:hypothetical protein
MRFILGPLSSGWKFWLDPLLLEKMDRRVKPGQYRRASGVLLPIRNRQFFQREQRHHAAMRLRYIGSRPFDL